MSIATFDTLKFANTLKAASVPAEQAEAMARAFAEVIQVNLKDLATRADVGRLGEELARVEKDLRAELGRVEKDLRAEIERLRAEMAREFSDVRAEIGRVAKEARDNLDDAVKDLKRDIAELRTEFKHDMALLRWMVGAGYALAVVIIGLLARLVLVPAR